VRFFSDGSSIRPLKKKKKWLAQCCPLNVKMPGRLVKCLFRQGFDRVGHIVCNPGDRRQQIASQKVIHSLSCT
jgi:hypothetical protein